MCIAVLAHIQEDGKLMVEFALRCFSEFDILQQAEERYGPGGAEFVGNVRPITLTTSTLLTGLDVQGT